MRITLEPTGGNVPLQHKVVVETDYDDMSLDDVFELFEMALKAWGFAECSINEYFGDESE